MGAVALGSLTLRIDGLLARSQDFIAEAIWVAEPDAINSITICAH